jgi:RecB family exonuclease
VGSGLNRFLSCLADACAAEPLTEKWLLAPSRRVGFQWLDTLARSGQAVLNVRVETVRTMALKLAAPELEHRGLGFLRGWRVELLVDGLLARLKSQQKGEGYLRAAGAAAGLTAEVAAVLRDLRLAGLSARGLKPGPFEVRSKGREIAFLLAEYERDLRTGKLADYAEVLRIAAARASQGGSPLAGGGLLLLPADAEAEFTGLERELWEKLPAESRRVLPVDLPGEGDGNGDAALLGWILRPTEAPAPRQDGSAEIFRAVGEVNEIREVLRRCVAEGIPFDQVEIIHTDAETYVPLVHELVAATGMSPEDEVESAATFAEGLPAATFRPGRALAAWVSWVRDGFPQTTLARMLEEGLLNRPGAAGDGSESGFGRMAAALRGVPVGFGRGAYLSALDDQIAELNWRVENGRFGSGDSERPDPEAAGRRLLARAATLRAVRELVAGLLEYCPKGSAPAGEVVASALSFLEAGVRCVSRMDQYARERLLDEIREMADCLAGLPAPAGFDPWNWLGGLPQSVRVGGEGPRPGRLLVSSLVSGGHSGRPHTFLVGLDDGRFPGTGRQSAVLLDGEREGISSQLPTARGRLARRVEALARLLARLRGKVTLSCSCRDLADDRETFPGAVLLSAFRVLSGERDADQGRMLELLPGPASFAPGDDGRCTDLTEWWLWRACVSGGISDPARAVARQFPHLGRGARARQARASRRFTEFDGHVPEAGADLDPAAPGGPVVSASRLETLGRCPLEYFFKYVLGVERPAEYELAPYVWLEPSDRGQLLHGAFRNFMNRLAGSGELPDFERHRATMAEVLEAEIAAYRRSVPPPNEVVFRAERNWLRRTAEIFLREEEIHCRESRPAWFELALGIESEEPGGPLDCAEPVEVRLPNGGKIRVRGRIDRVDRAGESDDRFSIWDYKTGGTWGYRRDDPFRGGRHVQNVLYLAMAEAHLRRVHSKKARVELFGYFFPSPRAHGERVSWPAEELRPGLEVVAGLCRLAAAGCFPLTDEPDEDLRFSDDYLAAFGDVAELAYWMRGKLENSTEKTLAPFRELRQGGEA